MLRPRVWVNYQPKIYSDILKQAIKSIGLVQVVEGSPADHRKKAAGEEIDQIDVVLVSLDILGLSEIELMIGRDLQSKIIAFSPSGEFGLRRLPGNKNWEELRPFGLKQLIEELSTETM
jgi:hypothetical protein